MTAQVAKLRTLKVMDVILNTDHKSPDKEVGSKFEKLNRAFTKINEDKEPTANKSVFNKITFNANPFYSYHRRKRVLAMANRMMTVLAHSMKKDWDLKQIEALNRIFEAGLSLTWDELSKLSKEAKEDYMEYIIEQARKAENYTIDAKVRSKMMKKGVE